MITPENIWVVLLAAASAVVLLSNAAEKIVKAVKTAKAPMNEQNARLETLELWREEVDLGGNHRDIHSWFKKYGYDMNNVRNDVAVLMG